MKKYIYALIIIFMLFNASCSKEEKLKNDKIIPVNICAVKPDTISDYIKLTGSITGENDAVVYSKISEKLENVFVNPGQKVGSGEVLAVQYNAVLRQSVELAGAALKTAQAQFELIESDYKRMGELYKQKAISPQQYDQIKTQKKTAEAALEQAKLQLEQANENYQNSFIKAPFAGIVGAVFFERDQMVPAGQPVVQVVSPDAMKSKLLVPEKEVAELSIGQYVEIEFPSVPGALYEGRVVKINRAIDRISNVLEIEVRLTRPDSRIKSGMFGEFRIETAVRKGIIVLPENSLMQQTEITVNKQTGIQKTVKKYFVFAVENGAAKLKEVKTGISNGGRIEITKGLKISDSVIVVGQNVVRQGQKVKVVE